MEKKMEKMEGWGWIFDKATYSDIVDSLRGTKNAAEYDLAIAKMVREESHIVVEADTRPSDIVIETFKGVNLDHYCIEPKDLPSWVLNA